MGNLRVFYAASGPSNLIGAHHHWKRGVPDPTEVSGTFSSQIEQFWQDRGATALLISTHPSRETLTDGSFSFEHLPKRKAAGIRYHLEQVRYGLQLLRKARRFRASLAIIDSGATHYFVLLAFAVFRLPVIVVLHNALWPRGFKPNGGTARVLLALDKLFWRFGATAAVAVSPECGRQVRSLAPSATYPIVQTRAQFLPSFFDGIAPPPSHQSKPFRIMFAGRIAVNKGGLDVVRMARITEDRVPGLIHWTICGDGPDADELRHLLRELKVLNAVDFLGWTPPAKIREVLSRSHACIVPTRSDFNEGLAMTAVEAVLAGRPLITNDVVPASELLEPACVLGEVDSVQSHAEQALALATDPALYDRKTKATSDLAREFVDESHGLAASLMAATRGPLA
jgi:glycogen(starch) synthase